MALYQAIMDLLGAFGFEGFDFEIPTVQINNLIDAIKSTLAGLEIGE